MIETYYAPHEVRYSWEQCQWIIINVFPLEAGKWPNDPRDSGYIGGNHIQSQHANFETACMVRGELLARVQRTGLAGRLLVVQLQANMSLDYDSKMALAYCCGNRRKAQKFSVWKADTEYRRKSILANKKPIKL